MFNLNIYSIFANNVNYHYMYCPYPLNFRFGVIYLKSECIWEFFKISLKVLLPIWIILISSFCLILGPIFQLQLWKCMVRMDILVELPFLIWSCLKPIHFYHTAVYIIIQYRNSLMNCTWYIATFRLLSMCTQVGVSKAFSKSRD